MATTNQTGKYYRYNRGIPHLYGKMDSDAVVGLLDVRCENDCNEVMNCIEKLGRLV